MPEQALVQYSMPVDVVMQVSLVSREREPEVAETVAAARPTRIAIEKRIFLKLLLDCFVFLLNDD